MTDKTLDNQNVAQAKGAIPDLKVFGDGDTWRLLCKASSESQGWLKSTKVLEVAEIGCFVQVTTQQRNHDGTNSVSEAVTFARGVCFKVLEGIPRLVAIPRIDR
jgi:hypothetical protein